MGLARRSLLALLTAACGTSSGSTDGARAAATGGASPSQASGGNAVMTGGFGASTEGAPAGVGGASPGAGGAISGGADPGGNMSATGGAGASAAGKGGSAVTGGGGSGCVDIPPPDAPLVKLCRPPTDDECDGNAPPWEAPGDDIAGQGNGFDDDCDGLVDEGCGCDQSGQGAVKPCWLLPSSLTSGASGTPPWTPQGWCNPNAKGAEVCVCMGCGELLVLRWSGKCMGAKKPLDQDLCVPGDLDCDGLSENPPKGCACVPPPP